MYICVAENDRFPSEPCWAASRIVGDQARPKACTVLLDGTTMSSVKSSQVFIFCSDRTLQTGVVYVCREKEYVSDIIARDFIFRTLVENV